MANWIPASPTATLAVVRRMVDTLKLPNPSKIVAVNWAGEPVNASEPEVTLEATNNSPVFKDKNLSPIAAPEPLPAVIAATFWAAVNDCRPDA